MSLSPEKAQMPRASGCGDAGCGKRILGKQRGTQVLCNPHISIYIEAPVFVLASLEIIKEVVVCSFFVSLQLIFNINLKGEFLNPLDTERLVNQENICWVSKGILKSGRSPFCPLDGALVS